MTRFRMIAAALSFALLQACMSTGSDPQNMAAGSASVATPPASQTYLLSWGMFADPVFDRDVTTFNRAFSARYGAPTQSWQYGANARGLDRPNVDNIMADIAKMAQLTRDGEDLAVVMLTSHGAPDSIAMQFQEGGPVVGVSADQLANLLAPLSNDRQILILQACFSGSLIDELQLANRIILTAAAADRSSFGCNPDSDNTWFIKSLNRAMAQGGSWEQVFARTRALVSADEAAMGVPASNPQRFVGANMRDVWTQNAQ